MSGQVMSRAPVWNSPDRTTLARIRVCGVPSSAAASALVSSTAAAPSLFGQQCSSRSGSATGREPLDIGRRHRRLEVGPRVVRAVAPVLDRDGGQGIDPGAEVVQVALGPHGVGGRHHHALVDLDVRGGQRQRAAAERGQVLHPDHQHPLVQPGRDGLPGQVHRGTAAGAGVLHGEDRWPGDADPLQHPLGEQRIRRTPSRRSRPARPPGAARSRCSRAAAAAAPRSAAVRSRCLPNGTTAAPDRWTGLIGRPPGWG